MEFYRICVVFALVLVVAEASKEHDLIKSLMKPYKKMGIKEARPVKDHTSKMNVTFGLSLVKADINEKDDSLAATIWYQLGWKDEYLQWSPEMHGGVRTIRLDVNDIWIPDIVLYNSRWGNSVKIDKNVLVVVNSDGMMNWIAPVGLAADCVQQKNATYTCRLKFGSWTYNGLELDLNLYNGVASVDTTSFEPNKYHVDINYAVRHAVMYECCPEPYIDLEFFLGFAKK